jgi:3-hydroxyisobutyrate dehydrogenase
VGGDKEVFDKYKKVLDAFGDQAAYIGPIGTATVAKLVHNMAGYAIQTAMAEVFSMGVKAGMDPLDLWKAVRQGALGRKRTFDRITDQFLVDKYDPPAFALKLAHKDVTLAVTMGRELNVPMRFCNLALEEMNEALNRGWENLDSRVPMKLQLERAGVEIKCDPAAVQAVLDADKAQ